MPISMTKFGAHSCQTTVSQQSATFSVVAGCASDLDWGASPSPFVSYPSVSCPFDPDLLEFESGHLFSSAEPVRPFVN